MEWLLVWLIVNALFSCGVSWSRRGKKTLGNLVSRQAYGVGYDIEARKACQSPRILVTSRRTLGNLVSRQTDALYVYSEPLTNADRYQIIEAATAAKIPTIFGF